MALEFLKDELGIEERKERYPRPVLVVYPLSMGMFYFGDTPVQQIYFSASLHDILCEHLKTIDPIESITILSRYLGNELCLKGHVASFTGPNDNDVCRLLMVLEEDWYKWYNPS